MFKNLFRKKTPQSTSPESSVKDLDSYVNVGQNVYPLIKSYDDPVFINRQSPLVARDLNNSLFVVYGVETQGQFILIDQQQLAMMQLTQEQIDEVAIRNIRNLASVRCDVGSKDFTRIDPNLAPFFALKTDKPISPSFVLIDEVWEDHMMKIVEDNQLVVAMPSKDDIYFCGFKNQGSFAALRLITEKKYEQAVQEGTQLSNRLFLRRDGSWQLLAIDAGNSEMDVPEPQLGDLLLASPEFPEEMADFSKSVILIFKSTETHVYGVRLNGHAIKSLKESIEGSDHEDVPVYNGGIVQQDTLTFIHRASSCSEESEEIIDGVYFAGDLGKIMANYDANEAGFFHLHGVFCLDKTSAHWRDSKWFMDSKERQ